MWPKFGNSNIIMREVTITTILQGFDQKKNTFLRGSFEILTPGLKGPAAVDL